MRFSTLCLHALLVGSVAARPTFDETPCSYGSVDHLDIGDTCTASKIRKAIKKVIVATECDWNVGYEIRLLTGTTIVAEANTILESLCDTAEASIWKSAEYSQWAQIHGDFTDEFMDLYTEGGTYLNDETGNFRNRDGSDPRDNSRIPTDDASYLAGQAIDSFYEDGARTSVLEPIDHLNTCENQAIMCCFGRDRQYRDGNGDCKPKDCDDAAPGDNSNICYLDGAEPQALPDDEQIHCHGLVWSSDESDPSYQLRFNSFFYVLMHDHMYSRGYVSPAVPGASMCGCVEDMSPVSRADCSEVDMQVNFFVSLSAETVLSVVPENLEFRFRACRGITADPDTPGDWVLEKNDLASKVNALVESGDMEETTQENIFNVLVGHDSPNDNANQAACEAAWLKVSPNTPYE